MPQIWTNSNSRCQIEWHKIFTNQFLLINIKSEQLSTFYTLQKLLEKVDDYNKKKY